MDRVVLGREVCYDDLKTILDKTDVDIEYFIHGAHGVFIIQVVACCLIIFHVVMLIGVDVSQSCRWYYDLYQGNQKINQDGVIPFSMSSKDMALIDHIPELIELGVDSFKIEGRMKSLHYIATIVSTYRKLIDDYCNDPDNFELTEKYYREIQKAANRSLCTGFFDDQAGNDKQLYNQRDEHPDTRILCPSNQL